jgi:hypothetical protein
VRLAGRVRKYSKRVLVIELAEPVDIEPRLKKHGNVCDVLMLDKRQITNRQRWKIYATFGDIAAWSGCRNDDIKNLMKRHFLDDAAEDKGYSWFSLSDCSVELARDFMDWMVDWCFDNRVPTVDTMLHRCADIERYLWTCLKHRRCAICNNDGEEHHVDVIGMGNNRKKVDDSNHRKICLCREHHDQAHNMGWPQFAKLYKVHGIIYRD